MAEEGRVCPECEIPIGPYSESTWLLSDGSTVDPIAADEDGGTEDAGRVLLHRFCALSARRERTDR
jgi:hypothetical protein